ncbi:pyocin activator PrtN family protein [Vibrio parahaemolyticus]|uniref:pyocin activator PrtN family protein n=2 Tax=Vibrio parahaemolyticus TaxID=670 RepID=UPI00084B6771|nr:pyocin activator PrtN family protein [Vibrio parahaemolyticus]EJG1716329.1 pyocin activator PrtN family protein [Vibrio parahaemolyticus]EKA7375004.1 pyocin activator PrtN family protein [Vibrio parahaemolyticus]ELA9377740.1 pyocin activator PrtN family protein [Vibrio parahaemolyticus]ELK8488075.1 pyocin activator PrtN family protein [Vibrio parahaemolyticus]ODZ46037.1 pyocin activator protein PrtN [Vibrio parahaemolyticus]
MNTHFALLARFESPAIELKQISQEFFGITPKTAEQRAKARNFPIPTFKLRDSERSPTLVKIEDLANHIDRQYEQAKNEWQLVND